MTERPRLHQSKAIQVLHWLLDDMERKANRDRVTTHDGPKQDPRGEMAS